MENVKKSLKNFFKINSNYKIANYSFLAIFVIGLISYYLIIQYGFSNPDGISEGFYYYEAADWASAGCGRWLIRYFNFLQGNIVIPIITVIEYCLFIWLTNLIIVKLFDIKSLLSAIISACLLMVTPGVITQMTYVFTAGAYGLSCLLSTLFVYFNRNKTKLGFVLGTACLTLSMGLYQSYIGQAAVVSIMFLLIRLIINENKKEVLDLAVKLILSAIIAAVLYFVIYKVDIAIHNLIVDDRAGMFSMSLILKSFGTKFIEMYKVFFSNFSDGVFKRDYIFICLLVLSAISLVLTAIKLFNKNISLGLIFVIGLLLIPPASEIIGILIPYNNVNIMMSTQNFIVFPFVLSLYEHLDLKILSYFKYAAVLSVCLLSWTYVLSANCTYRCYKLSYDHINNEVSMIIDDIYDLDAYVKDETPIMFGGFPNDHYLRDNLRIYNYTIELYPNVIFWQDMNGVLKGRHHYFMNIFGIDAGEFTSKEYYDVMTGEEFASMPIWPSKGSIKMIDGFAVVKFRNDPLLPSE